MRSDCVGGQLTSKPLPCFEKTNKQTKMMGRLRAADYDKKLKLMIHGKITIIIV